ncbi:glycoside hydrolase [Bacteroides nordii]|jgi:hypothetical protein
MDKLLIIGIWLFFSTVSYAQNTYKFTVNPAVKYQEIDHFGASDCWTMYRFGKYATEENVDKVADLFFSKEFDDNGFPKGIGLSMWRMNLGAGSHDNAFQAYRDIRGRMPCILKKSGYYDMALDGSCGGQFNFLKKAKERECEYTLGFCNSPPYFMTRSGYTTGNEDPNKPLEAKYSLSLNITDEGIENFTEYMSEVIKRTEEVHGVTFDYIDPVNEPEWGAWIGENMHATNGDIKKIVSSLNHKLATKGLKTKIAIPESARLDYLYTVPNASAPLNAQDYGKKIENFFSPSGNTYVGNLSNISRHIAGHGYFTTDPETQLLQYRSYIPELLNKFNVKYWMTEYSLGDSFDEYVNDQWGVDLSIDYGLFVARIIHADLVVGNASAWHWWLGVTDLDYKDGLIYLKRNGNYRVAYQMIDDPNGIAPEKAYKEVYGSCEVVQTKLLWCLGNYSRFIRPGARRISVTSSVGTNNIRGLMISAFENSDGKLVVVAINYSEGDQQIVFNVKLDDEFYFQPYITSDKTDDNLRPMPLIRSTERIIIPKRSVVTFVQTGNTTGFDPVTSDKQLRVETYTGGIKILNEGVNEVEIWNMYGQFFKKHSILKDNTDIELPKGIYLIRCRTNDKCVLVGKVVI